VVSSNKKTLELGLVKKPVAVVSRACTEKESMQDARTGEASVVIFGVMKLRVFL